MRWAGPLARVSRLVDLSFVRSFVAFVCRIGSDDALSCRPHSGITRVRARCNLRHALEGRVVSVMDLCFNLMEAQAIRGVERQLELCSVSMMAIGLEILSHASIVDIDPTQRAFPRSIFRDMVPAWRRVPLSQGSYNEIYLMPC